MSASTVGRIILSRICQRSIATGTNQHDGVLLFDAKRGVHHDDEGTLSSTGEDVATMRVTAKT